MNYDRFILELMDRVSLLEEEVAKLKKELKGNGDSTSGNEIQKKAESAPKRVEGKTERDSTNYLFDGRKYGKNRLVLAIVKKYVEMNPGITAEQLMQIFEKDLQGSLGVVRLLSEVQARYDDYRVRFFAEPDEIIHVEPEACVVCTQWGVANIGNILARAEELNMPIDKIR